MTAVDTSSRPALSGVVTSASFDPATPTPTQAFVAPLSPRSQHACDTLAALRQLPMRAFRGEALNIVPDPNETLRVYDRTVAVAHHLATQRPDLAASVHAALPDLGLPDDLMVLVASAVGCLPEEALVNDTDASPLASPEAQWGQPPSRPLGHEAMVSDLLRRRLAAGDPTALALSDAGLELLRLCLTGTPLPTAPTASWHIAIARALDRMVALGFTTRGHLELKILWQWMGDPDVNDEAVADAVLPLMLRLGTDAAEQIESMCAKSAAFAGRWAATQQLWRGAYAPPPARGSATASQLAAHALKGVAPGKAGAEQLVTVLDDRHLEPCALLRELVAVHEEKGLARIDLAAHEPLADAAVKILMRDGHLPIGCAVLGLCTQGAAPAMQRFLAKQGLSTEQAAPWIVAVQACEALDAKTMRAVLQPALQPVPNFRPLALRLGLSRIDPFEAEAAQALTTEYRHLGPGAVRAIAEMAAIYASPAVCIDLGQWLLDAALMPIEHVRAGLGDGCYATLFPDVHQKLIAAAERVASALYGAVPALIPALQEAIDDVSHLTGRLGATSEALEFIADKQQPARLPLGAAAPLVQRRSNTVEVGGQQLVRQQPPADRLPFVPQVDDFALLPTAARNLEALASFWLCDKRVLLEGPTGCGKSMLLAYVAAQTRTPLHTVVCSQDTDVYDLIGRHVPGDEMFSAAERATMSDARATAILHSWGIEPDPHGPAPVEQLAAAQKRPRWVDGPILQAAKRGEAVVLEDVNLCRSDVVECLNALLDDDRFLVVTLNKSEVVKPQPGFKLFATQNDDAYAGRVRHSVAFASRWCKLPCEPLSRADLFMLVRGVLDDSCTEIRTQLLTVHEGLVQAMADGAMGRVLGSCYTARNLLRAARRFKRYRGQGLVPKDLMQREVREEYSGVAWTDAERRRLRQGAEANLEQVYVLHQTKTRQRAEGQHPR